MVFKTDYLVEMPSGRLQGQFLLSCFLNASYFTVSFTPCDFFMPVSNLTFESNNVATSRNCIFSFPLHFASVHCLSCFRLCLCQGPLYM